MTRQEIYEKLMGIPHPNCPTPNCDDCPLNGRGCHTNEWWGSKCSAGPDDTPKITINFSNTSKESICDELIGFITTAFSPNNSIPYALGISDCLKMIEDFKKEASKE